jgi:hypothetical protein
MIEKNDLLMLRIEALRVLARTNEPNRAVLIERNIEDHLKTSGSERAAPTLRYGNPRSNLRPTHPVSQAGRVIKQRTKFEEWPVITSNDF